LPLLKVFVGLFETEESCRMTTQALLKWLSCTIRSTALCTSPSLNVLPLKLNVKFRMVGDTATELMPYCDAYR
jgi:hypothetical protein